MLEILSTGLKTFVVPLPCGDDVEVGDKEAIDFKPKARIKRWDGECSLTLELPTDEKVLPVVEDKKVKWKGEDTNLEMFSKEADDENENGGFEYDIVLKKKPKSNVQTLNFNSDNLKFYYQPPLTQEYKAGWSDEFQCNISVTETDVTNTDTGDNLVHRPEKVVGSYVAYHATKSNIHSSQAEADKYKTGQPLIWFRPKIRDSSSPPKDCWCKLNIDEANGVRRIVIPQDFLDNGIPPFTIDDWFGSQETAGSGGNFLSNQLHGATFTSPADTDTGISISAYVQGTSSSFSLKGVLVLRSNLNIVANGIGSPTALSSSYAWRTSIFSTSPSITPSTAYVLMAINNDPGTPKIKYNSGGTNQLVIDGSNSYSSPSNPTDAFFANLLYSIYCTYTAGGGGAAYVPKFMGIT